MVRKSAFLLAVFIMILQTAVYAGELYSTDVRQVYCYSDLLRTYTDIEDVTSNSVSKPERSEVNGYIDGNKLTVQNINRFGDTNEGVADIFLVDISGSMKNNQMNQVKSALKTWAINMKENDRMAIITFGDNVGAVTDFSNNKNAIDNAINSITNNDKKTQLYGGLAEALKLSSRDDVNLPKRKNIILITDGVNDYSGGISENDIYSQLKESLVPVYCMWMSGSKASNQKGEATLSTVAEYSGGRIYNMSDKNINTVYSWISQSIQNSYTIDFAYGDAVADGGKHSLEVKVSQNDKMTRDDVSFTFKKNSENSGEYIMGETTKNSSRDNRNAVKPIKGMYIIIAIIIVAAAGLIVGIVMVVSNKKNNDNYSVNSSNIYSGGQSNSGEPMQYSNVNNNPQMYDNTVGSVASGKITVVFINSESGNQQTAEMHGVLNIGRAPNNEFIVNDELVSGRHCAITNIGGNMYIEDLSSTNGTMLNGCMVTSKVHIKNNDLLLIGNSEYRISFIF